MAPSSPAAGPYFNGLQLRPPTPPRETERIVAEACDFLSDSFEVSDVTARPPLHNEPVVTPLKIVPASADSAATNSRRPKKVDFSPWTDYHRPEDFLSRRGSITSPPRPLPQPKDPTKLKGILKARPPNATPSSAHSQSAPKFDTFAEMLESLVKQLAGASRSHRRDSYVTLVSTLKAYDHFPETQSLVEKMGLLSQFIQRDIATPIAIDDAQLAQQALKLLSVLINLPDVARHIPAELQVAFVNCAVQAFGDEKVLKKLVNPFLVTFSCQNFGPKVMTPAVVDKVITSIQDIHERVSGLGVLAARLDVYKKLLAQSPDVMVSRASDWLPHVLNGMLRDLPHESRRKALEVGHGAAISIGDKPKISRLVMELMDKTLENGQSFGKDYVRRMQIMMTSRDESLANDVPKVWAVIILFLRGRHRDIHEWKLFQQWFKIIQDCLNSSQKDVVVNANAAWSRFIYAIKPDTRTTPTMRTLLRQGVALQLDRFDRKAVSTNERSMGSAFSSYCALLYCSLPPMASEEQLDLYWEEYVAQVLLERMIKKSQTGANRACQVLTDLFKSNKTGVWNENLVLQGLVTPGHLPGLDPKWVRRKLSVILQLVQPCLSNAAWDSPSADHPTFSVPSVRNMWLALMSTVAEAGSKEITVSMEFKAASAHIMNFLHRIWNKFPASLGLKDDEDEEWIERFGFLVTTAVQTLGPLHFADPILKQSSPDNFEPVPTPSNRTKNRGDMQSPLLYLLHMFARSEHSPLVLDLSKKLITLASDSRVRRPRLELLYNCAQEATASVEIASRRGQHTGIWIHVASLAKSALEDPSVQLKNASSSPSLGEEYRSVLSILTCGLQFAGTEVLATAGELYNTLVAQVTVEAGNGAPSIAVTEPLAESVVAAGANPALDRSTIIGFAILALTHITPPKDRKSLDNARKALWGVGVGPQKPAIFDPYNHLYKMILSLLHFAYENLDELHPQPVIDFVLALAALLKRWPASNTAIMLRKIQGGVALWVEDRDKKLEREGEDSKAGKKAVDSFWTVVMAVVVQLPRKDTMLLRALEHLIASGLNSRQRRVVNKTIETWNSTFGKESTLEYPSQVEKALRRLRPHLGVELELPNFPSGPTDEDLGPAPAFEDSQESASVNRASSRLAARSTIPTPSSRVAKQKSVKPIPKAKLCHDDSQIDFTAIESSPGQEVPVDSQLLTEHQKEVRENQHGSAAVMFPDINSSPAPMSKRNRSEVVKATELPSDLPSEVEGSRRSTPVLAALASDGLQDLGGSSPTPKSRSERNDPRLDQNYITSSAADRFFETEIPSSPPRMDDDNDIPTDSSVVKESFANLSQMSAGGRPSASGLSQDSPISILTDSFDSLDSDGDESARQLADESQARQSLRTNEPAAMTSDPTVEDTHVKSEEFGGNTESNLNGFDSFSDIADELPQGTAEVASSLAPAKITVDDALDQEIHDVFSTPAGARSQSPAQVDEGTEVAQSQDDSVVQDSFIRSEVNMAIPNKEEPVPNGKQDQEGPPTTKNQRKRTKKRKNQAVEEGPSKRIKNTSHDQGNEESTQVTISSGQGKASQDDGSVGADKASKTKKPRKSSSSAQAQRPAQPELRYERLKWSSPQVQFSDESTKSLLSESILQSSQASDAPDSRVSPRLAGKVPQEALYSFRKRKSRLSESQTIDDDQEMNHEETNYGDTTIDLDVVHETPAPKKRRGRPPKNGASNASETSQSIASPQEASNASGTGPTRGRGRPRKNSIQASGSQSQQEHGRSDDIESTAAAEARSTRSSKQKSDNAGAGEGGTAATETSSSRAELQHDATAASQASQASDGRRRKEPRSILARLKQLLADAKSMVVGRDEERECCDVMFELQREVHEAARRGEAQGQ
ncbi:Rap1-interacting factor 1 N terminal-domain-containing protein [Phyllosticta citrichinensis]|uniref:Rap1-interacting factor 1 N terminal-domain-containing protein n=1 Tax=Phyllosticta citrichinensis TaxID=1130410 RepID=A0ABR1Y7X9_9PEZI